MTDRIVASRTGSASGPSRASFLATVMLGVLLSVALAACGKKDDAQGGAGAPGAGGPPPPLPVTVLEAKATRVPITVETVGQSEGSKEIQVRARVSGILLKQRFTEGDPVKAGFVMYQIDPVPYQIALEQAKAALAQAQAGSEQAVREQKRLKPLAEEQAVSGKDYDDATSTSKTAAAMVQARQADVHNAELNLSYTQVIAPISGITGRNISSEGSLITVNTDSALLTTIAQTNPIWVRFAIDEREYDALRAQGGQSAKVDLILPDGKLYGHPGKLNFTASTVDRNLGTVQLRAEVPNPDLRILPGQFVNTKLYINEIEAFLVPQVAVMTNDKGKSVMIVGPDNKVVVRPVDAGTWQGDLWVIRKGLQNGDRVIVDNLVKVRPGATVDPHPPQQQQGAQGGGQQPQGDGSQKAGGDAGKSNGDAKP